MAYGLESAEGLVIRTSVLCHVPFSWSVAATGSVSSCVNGSSHLDSWSTGCAAGSNKTPTSSKRNPMRPWSCSLKPVVSSRMSGMRRSVPKKNNSGSSSAKTGTRGKIVRTRQRCKHRTASDQNQALRAGTSSVEQAHSSDQKPTARERRDGENGNPCEQHEHPAGVNPRVSPEQANEGIISSELGGEER